MLPFGTSFLAVLCMFTGSWWWKENFPPNAKDHFWVRRQNCASQGRRCSCAEVSGDSWIPPKDAVGGWRSGQQLLTPWCWWVSPLPARRSNINFRLLNPTLLLKDSWNHYLYIWRMPLLAASAYAVHPTHKPAHSLFFCKLAWCLLATASCHTELSQQSITQWSLFLKQKKFPQERVER